MQFVKFKIFVCFFFLSGFFGGQIYSSNNYRSNDGVTRSCCSNASYCYLYVHNKLTTGSLVVDKNAAVGVDLAVGGKLAVGTDVTVGGNLMVNNQLLNSSGNPYSPFVALGYASFYALMPGDNAATIAAGSPVLFPNVGPSSGSSIMALTSSTFQLADIGTYEVTWQVAVDEPGQLILVLDGLDMPETVVGRATGSSQIVGSTFITTTVANSVLSINNPSGNVAALTITPNAGGNRAVSATLTIKRLS